MKRVVVLLTLVGTVAAHADPRTLEPAEIQQQLKPVSEQIGRCYKAATPNVRGAGKLQLTLTIHRTGALDGIDVATPGLPAKTAKQIDGCVRAAVGEITFPARRRETTAILPFFFQRT